MSGKKLSTEEALCLILETSDGESGEYSETGESEDSEVDVVSLDAPTPAAPSAVKIDVPDAIDIMQSSTGRDFVQLRNLDAGALRCPVPSVASSSPTASPASTPPSSPVLKGEHLQPSPPCSPADGEKRNLPTSRPRKKRKWQSPVHSKKTKLPSPKQRKRVKSSPVHMKKSKLVVRSKSILSKSKSKPKKTDNRQKKIQAEMCMHYSSSDSEPTVKGLKNLSVRDSSDSEPMDVKISAPLTSDSEPMDYNISAPLSSDSEPMDCNISAPPLAPASSDSEPMDLQTSAPESEPTVSSKISASDTSIHLSAPDSSDYDNVTVRKKKRINPSSHIPSASSGGYTDFSTDTERTSDVPSSSDLCKPDDSSKFLPPENFPGPPRLGKDIQKDLDDLDESLEDFDLGETLSQTVSRPNFLISKIPFRIMCMYIKRYLISIQLDPSHPQWPVPGMDKNQKRHFRRKVECYTVKKGILYYLHKFSAKTIGYE